MEPGILRNTLNKNVHVFLFLGIVRGLEVSTPGGMPNTLEIQQLSEGTNPATGQQAQWFRLEHRLCKLQSLFPISTLLNGSCRVWDITEAKQGLDSYTTEILVVSFPEGCYGG